LWHSLSAADRSQIIDHVRTWLPAPAFELNLMALYILRFGGISLPVLQDVVGQHCRSGCIPARDAVAAMSEAPPVPSSEASQQSEVEPDETPSPY
jgi:hypothetical protein